MLFKILTAIGIVSVVGALIYWIFKSYKDRPFSLIAEILDWWTRRQELNNIKKGKTHEIHYIDYRIVGCGVWEWR